ncbi:hypothetical protein LJC56_06765 [Christensenellaceae bacterium OttesenSCG-928-K19]|nr:hypothetical protein [Christensenellaceae bacterium OttesenSCG-928-K19]
MSEDKTKTNLNEEQMDEANGGFSGVFYSTVICLECKLDRIVSIFDPASRRCPKCGCTQYEITGPK